MSIHSKAGFTEMKSLAEGVLKELGVQCSLLPGDMGMFIPGRCAMVKVNGVVRQEVTLSGWVDVFESAVCTARPLKKGEILKKDDLYLTRENVSRLRGQALTDVGKAVGLMVRHSVRQNTCLMEWMLEKAPVLDKGAVVNLTRLAGAHPDTVLDRANRKFHQRFEALEDLARERGIALAEAGLEVLDGLWEEMRGRKDGS